MKAIHYDTKYNITCLQKHTKPIISAPLYFPIHHNHSHMCPSIMIAVCRSAGISPNSLHRAADHRTYWRWTACASVIASVHFNSQPGERHPQWTECCRLVQISAIRPVMFWKCHCIWCAPSTPFGIMCHYAKVESFRISHCLGANLFPTSRRIWCMFVRAS